MGRSVAQASAPPRRCRYETTRSLVSVIGRNGESREATRPLVVVAN
jgi:hypothetical protein